MNKSNQRLKLYRSARTHKDAKQAISPSLRAEIAMRDGYRCTYCGQQGTLVDGPDGERWNLDHVRPVAMGGDHLPSNLALSCRQCNALKGQRTPEQWRAGAAFASVAERAYPSGRTVYRVRWWSRVDGQRVRRSETFDDKVAALAFAERIGR